MRRVARTLRRGLRRIPWLVVLWVTIGLLFTGGLAFSQRASSQANQAASTANAEVAALKKVAVVQAQQVKRLKDLVSVSCVRSIRGAQERNALIVAVTKHIPPGILPPAATALRNHDLDVERVHLTKLGAGIPKVSCKP